MGLNFEQIDFRNLAQPFFTRTEFFQILKALTFYLSDIHVVIIKNRIW